MIPAVKPYFQKLFRSVGLYQRIKASLLYDLYWGIADRRIINERREEIEFYRNALKGFRKGDLIFDVGANHGQKTDVFLRLGAKVVAVDPDETNQEALKQKFLKYRLIKKPVVVIGKAVSDRDAVETMWIDEPGSAKNTLSQKWVETLRADGSRFGKTLDFGQKKPIQTITLEGLMKTYGLPFFVKIDVEGYEPCVLRGLQRSVPYLSFEVNLPEFKPEGFQCIESLAVLDNSGKFNYTVDCRRGLALDRWLGVKEFEPVFERCFEKSIEVFWRTGEPGGSSGERGHN